MTKRSAKPPILLALLFFVFSFGCFHVAGSEAFTLAAQHGNVESECAEIRLLLGRIECAQLDLTCSSGVVPLVSSRTLPTPLTGEGLLRQASAPNVSEKDSSWERKIFGSEAAAIPKTPRHIFHSILIL